MAVSSLLEPFQRSAGILSISISIIIMCWTYVWAARSNNPVEGWLNGFNDCTKHAVLMITGMGFCYPVALLSFRIGGKSLGHDLSKAMHGFFHLATLILVMTALVFIVLWHNDSKLGHLSSLHSWLGVLLLGIYIQNIVGGSSIFGGFNFSDDFKVKYLPSHRFLGKFIFILLFLLILILLFRYDCFFIGRYCDDIRYCSEKLIGFKKWMSLYV